MKHGNGRHQQLRTLVYAVLLIFFLVPTIYFASVGPMFGILSATPGPGWSGKPIRRIYRPLFDVAPEITMQYLRLWGVSDIEAFFIMQSSKGEPN